MHEWMDVISVLSLEMARENVKIKSGPLLRSDKSESVIFIYFSFFNLTRATNKFKKIKSSNTSGVQGESNKYHSHYHNIPTFQTKQKKMGLAEVKRKQRLVGSAQTKNSAWSNDSSLPGQRLLASMGWSAGQGIGQSRSGMVAPVAVAFKMDNKGIGAQRLEREARASGQADAWIGGGGELGNLFDRLNAAAALNDSPASTSKNGIISEEETKKADKERRRAEKKEKKKEKAKELDNEVKAIEQKATSAPVMINPRMAARAKYLRAKRMVGNDLSSVNEILGIASPSGSNSPAPIASPALSPKLADPSSEEEDTESERKKEKKRKREGSEMDEKDGSKTSSKSDKEERKRRKEEKKLAKASKKEEKRKAKSEASQDNVTPQPASIVAQDTSDPSFSASGGGNRVSTLSVQQYLSNKLMLRKAEIVRKRRLQEDGVWSRAATVQA